MKDVEKFARASHWLPTIALCCTLAACGGGGGGGDTAPAGPTGSALTLTGTAATGAAIAGGAVEAKCASGSGTATTAPDGSFTVNIATATLPCLLRVPAGGGTFLHSLAAGSGASVVANITPLTHLVVAALAAGDPATFYAGFSSSTAGSVTTSSATAAIASVVAKLTAAGFNLTGVDNLLNAPIVVAANSAPGNAYDALLDAVKTKLTSSGTTLAQLTQAVVTEAKAAADPTLASSTPSLPSDLLLQPAAANCAALRSGKYRAVFPHPPTTAGTFPTNGFTLDATTLTLVNEDLSAGTLTATSTPCQFTSGTTGSTIVVSQAGVIAFRSNDNGVMRMGVAFPEQAHTVAELAGAWNKLGFTQTTGTTFAFDAATLTLNGSGASTAISYCADVKAPACTPVTDKTVTFTVSSSGGFVRTSSDGTSDRAFAYRAGGGEWMMVTVFEDGGFGFWTHQRTNALPTVGAETSLWNLADNNLLVSPSVVTVGGNTILTTEPATGIFTRKNITTPATSTAVAITRPETLQINNPRPGYTYRNAATGVTDSSGATVNVPEFVSMSLRGMGVTPVAQIASGQFNLSVTQ